MRHPSFCRYLVTLIGKTHLTLLGLMFATAASSYQYLNPSETQAAGLAYNTTNQRHEATVRFDANTELPGGDGETYTRSFSGAGFVPPTT